jgi:hypothetical protein
LFALLLLLLLLFAVATVVEVIFVGIVGRPATLSVNEVPPVPGVVVCWCFNFHRFPRTISR